MENERKKILFVTSALGGGGAERVLSILLKHYISNKEIVKVVSLISDRHEYVDDIEVENIFIGGRKNKIKKAFDRYFKLKKEIKKFKPDIIISFGAEINMYALIAKGNIKCKMIISERNDPNKKPNNGFLRKIRNLLYKKADTIVFQTEDARNYFNKISDNKCEIISNPVNDNLPEYNKDEINQYIFSAGRLNEQKNFEMLINAFSKFATRHTDIKLLIAGEGPEKNNLEKLIKDNRMEERIELIGFKTNLYEYMSKASAFVLTSNYEGMSNVMLEAMGIGVPTICTDCPIGGARMTIEDGVNGFLIPMNDTDKLLNFLERVIYDNKISKYISNNSKKIKKTNSIRSICKKWDEIIYNY